MFFRIEHVTEYVYPTPAVESFSELRLRPRDTLRQTASHHQTRVMPSVLIENYTDYFGNYVETISIPFRHHELRVSSVCEVVTEPCADALSNLKLLVCETRQLMRSNQRELHDFLRPSRYVHFSEAIRKMAQEFLPDTGDFAAGVMRLNRHIYKNFKYLPGVTDVNTHVSDFLKQGKGVCQDFAHLMIAVLRMAGIPARYVSGYIETDPAPEGALVGATASHAWVEVYAPNGFWVGLDPTNDQLESERHVQIGIGRDYADVPPLKGIFKGPGKQTLSVTVSMTRSDLKVEDTPDN